MTPRRRFIALVPALVPFGGVSLLAACSKESSTSGTASLPAPSPSPATSPAPSPAPAPLPDPAPTTAPTTTAPATGTTGTTSGQSPVPPSGTTASLPVVQESDPVAVGLGYVSVASKADTTKYKNYAPGQACANCSLYAGQPTDPQAPCPLFAGKHVLAGAWCSAYVKRAG